MWMWWSLNPESLFRWLVVFGKDHRIWDHLSAWGHSAHATSPPILLRSQCCALHPRGSIKILFCKWFIFTIWNLLVDHHVLKNNCEMTAMTHIKQWFTVSPTHLKETCVFITCAEHPLTCPSCSSENSWPHPSMGDWNEEGSSHRTQSWTSKKCLSKAAKQSIEERRQHCRIIPPPRQSQPHPPSPTLTRSEAAKQSLQHIFVLSVLESVQVALTNLTLENGLAPSH